MGLGDEIVAHYVLGCGGCVAVEKRDGDLAFKPIWLEALNVMGQSLELDVRCLEGAGWVAELYCGWVLLYGNPKMRTKALEVTNDAVMQGVWQEA